MSAADFCTVEASTKRPEDLGSGRTGAPIAQLGALLVTPLWPVSRETISTLALNSPREFKECYHVPAAGASLPDVAEGDVLGHESVEYRVAYAGEWTDSDVPALTIVAQQIKGT